MYVSRGVDRSRTQSNITLPKGQQLDTSRNINFSIIPIILAGTGRQQTWQDHPGTEKNKMQILGRAQKCPVWPYENTSKKEGWKERWN